MPADLEVRPVTPADWRAVKHLRLAALLDAPLAFCERWSDAAALDDAAWQARASREDAHQVMAWDGARPVATATGRLGDGDQATVWLQAVHVAPDWRGRGVLERVVEPVAQWARARGASALHLEVHERNLTAAAAYRRLGFALTGGRRPYPLDPSTGDELEMSRALG